MSAPASRQPPNADRLEAATEQAIAACGGNVREAVKALIVANEFLERRLEELASPGYARGRVLPRDRKDWYD
jgi:stage V sporulation protein SpoVS